METDFGELLNLKAISQFQSIFYKLTGLPVSFCNSKLEGITFYPKTRRSRICKLIQSASLGFDRCRASDSEAIEKALQKGRPHIYRCHAGLVNVAIPLIVDGTHVGSLISGQVLTSPLGPESLDSLYQNINIKDLNIKAGLFKAAMGGVDIVPESKLRLAAQLLSLVATYIIERELSHNNAVGEPERGGDLHERLKRSEPFGNLDIGTGYEGAHLPPKRVILSAIDFITEHLSEGITLNDVACAVYLSPTYFARVFREETGLPFHAYLTRARMKFAAQLLNNPSLTVAEIAYQSGYQDANYFSQAFKAHFGCSPTEYRNRISIGRVTI